MEKSITGDSRVMAIDDYKKNIEANKDAPITNHPRFLFAKKYSDVLSLFLDV